MPIFAVLSKKVVVTFTIFGVMGLILTKLAQDVATMAPSVEYFLIRTAIFLPVSECQPVGWRSFCQFCPKLVAMATSLEEPKKRFRSIIYEQIPIIWWKDRDNRSSGFWDNFLRAIIKKRNKEINASKYIALPASLPSRLTKKGMYKQEKEEASDKGNKHATVI